MTNDFSVQFGEKISRLLYAIIHQLIIPRETGDTSLVIEDTVVSGQSIADVADSLADRCGVHVTNAIVVLDRSQGAAASLNRRGITLHACVDVFE